MNWLKKIDDLSSNQKHLTVFSLFAILISIIYGRTIGFDYCIDDQYYLWLFDDNPTNFSERLTSIRQRFWGSEFRPVTFFSILLEAIIFGNKPSVHHFFNLIYYLILCFSGYLLIFKYFKHNTKSAYVLSLLTLLFFLLHPSHANVVSSIKNRETIISFTWGIWALYAWFKYLDTKKLTYSVLSALLLIIGVFAKKDIASFALFIPIAGWLYASPNFSFKTSWKGHLTFYALIGILFISILQLGANPIEDKIFMQFHENPLIVEGLSIFERIPYSLYILSIYEKFMVVPTDYHFYFGYDQLNIIKEWNFQLTVVLLLHVFIVLITIRLWKSNNKKYLLGVFWFFIALSPFVFSIVAGYVGVRYSFIASFGFCLITVQILFLVWQKLNNQLSNTILLGMMGAILILSSWYSINRSSAWKDIYTLYQKDLPKLKKSVVANRMACVFYFLEAEKEKDVTNRKELLQQSQFHADQALSTYSYVPLVLEYKAKGLYSLNRPQEAIPFLKQLLKIDSENLFAITELAYYTREIQDFEISIDHFESLVKLDSMNINVYNDLTQLYIFKKNFEEAKALNQLLQDHGNTYDASLNYGDIYMAMRDTMAALNNYFEALNIKKEALIVEEIVAVCQQFSNDSLKNEISKLLKKTQK